jgi:dinuclear metal center YbgI/SA1388 family protein
MIARDEIVGLLDEELEVLGTEDESLNGLQVQGAADVGRVALATDAALSVYRRAAALGCEMLVVHHGILWSQPKPITGLLYEQVRTLVDEEMSLYAAHLPLDLHPRLGNNAELARMVGLVGTAPFGRYHGRDIGCTGELPGDAGVEDLAGAWRSQIGGRPAILPFGPERIRTVGIVSGGGCSLLPEAVDRGLDCFVTGEAAHWTHHMALEAGIHVIFLGHYHSETPGVRAVGRFLEERLGLETHFIDEPTLV